MDTDDYCRAQTIAANEPMLGTANDGVTAWIFLEYPGQWGPKVPKQAEGLPQPVIDRLLQLDAEVPHLRVQLIRRPGGFSDASGRPMLIVACVDPEQPGRSRVVWRRLSGYEEAAKLEPANELCGATGAMELVAPLYLVCTHGSRDRCCSKWGVPVFKDLCARAGDEASLRVWQTSHLGGHRFAPVVMTLPDGYVYGRVAPDELESLWTESERGRIYDLDRLRGRSCFSPAVQFADVELRRTDALVAYHELSLVEVEVDDGPNGQGTTRATFSVTGGELSMSVARGGVELSVLGSCGDDTYKKVRPWRVVPD